MLKNIFQWDTLPHESYAVNCEDFGIAEYAAIAGVVSAAAGAGTAIYSAQSQSAWNSYNAAVARQQAEAARATAAAEAEKKREQGAQLMARQQVLYAKGGVSLEGSPTDVILGTSEEVEMDAMNILRKGAIASGQYSSTAVLDEMKASSTSTAGYVSGGSTLLTGAGKTMSAYKVPTYTSDYTDAYITGEP